MPGNSAPAAVLRLVGRHGHALGVAVVREGNHDFLLVDEVVYIEIVGDSFDAGAAIITVLVADFEQILLDDFKNSVLVRENIAQLVDFRQSVGKLCFELVALQAGQTPERHLPDCGGLHLI